MFKDKISIHNEHQVYSSRRVGLKYLFKFSKDENGRREREPDVMSRRKPYYNIARLVLLAIFVFTVLKRRGVDSLLWGISAVFWILISSRYYYSILALIPIFGLWNNKKSPHMIHSITILSMITIWYITSFKINQPNMRYLFMNWMLFSIFVLWYIISTLNDWFNIDLKENYNKFISVIVKQEE
jgi:hypothetical protein